MLQVSSRVPTAARLRPTRTQAAFVGATVGLLALHVASTSTVTQNATYALVGVAALAAVLWGTRGRRGEHGGGWRWLACGIALWVAGDVTWGIADVAGEPGYPSLSDGLYLAGYPLLALGALAFAVGGRSAREAADDVLDVGIVAVGALALLWPLSVGPSVENGWSAATAVDLAYPLGDLLLLALLAALWLRPAKGSSALALLTLAVGATLVADAAAYASAHVPTMTDTSTNLLWLVGYVLFGLAALDGPAVGPPTAARVRTPVARMALVTSALLALPAALILHALVQSGFHAHDLRFFATLATVVVVLIAVRGAQMLRALSTANARAETARDRLAAVLDAAGVGILVRTDEYMRVTNRALQDLLGYSREELAAMSYLDIIHPDDRERALTRPPVAPDVKFHAEVKLLRRDGAAVETEVTVTGAPDGATVVVIDDVTERRQLEREFVQAQKQEAIGRLAGGVAHDFNNLLTAVTGNAELLRVSPGLSAEDTESVDAILRSAERAAALTRQLHQLSRSGSSAPEVVDVPTMVRTAVDLLRRLVPSDIDVEVRLAADAPPVYADPTQVDQVLLNLAVNARDAMPSGGTLRFAVDRWRNDGSDRALADLPVGDCCRIVVEDTGVGMDAATRGRIFEPFFTTKEKGKGTGLGLPTVYTIVTRANGHIRVDSEPGRGTRFQVLLPAADPGLEATEVRAAA
jgi:PAS domain S-box-containing protein